MEIEHGSGAENGNPQEILQRDCLCILYALCGNAERIFMQLPSGIKLGGAANPKENRIHSGLDVLEKQIAWNWVCLHEVQGFMCLRPGWERFHIAGLHLGTGWMSPQCWGPAKQADVLWDVWTVTDSQFWGAIQLCSTAEGSAGEFGVLWHQFHENGLIRESPVRTDRKNPRSCSQTITKKDWRRSQERRGKETSEPWGMEREMPRPGLQQVRSWLEIWKPADEKDFTAAISQRMPKKQQFEPPSAHLSALHVLEASGTR